MSTSREDSRMFIDQIFAVSGLRADHWRELLAIARRWQTGKAEGQDVKNALTLLRAVETLHAYPGPQLMTALEGYLDAGQKEAFVALASRISFSIVANYYKEDAREWEVNPDLSQARAELPGAAQHGPHRPYFEVLIVAPADSPRVARNVQLLRAQRRDQDEFIYEPVVVGSFQDAFSAIASNSNINAVVYLKALASRATTPCHSSIA